MALYLVIGTLIVVVILARAILAVIVSHRRITRHNVARVQAYYAAQAGMNYAFERLRTGSWSYTDAAVNSCPNPTGCIRNESEFPSSIMPFNAADPVETQFQVIFCPAYSTCAPSTIQCRPPWGQTYCVNISVRYVSPDIPT